MIALIAVLALLLIAGVLLRRRRASARLPSTTEAGMQSAIETGRFDAVSIRSGEQDCNAVRALRGQRFLSAAAPLLPLAECDAGECNCRYVHHADRRHGTDRRSPFQSGFGGSAARVDEDKRQQPDRRSDQAS